MGNSIYNTIPPPQKSRRVSRVLDSSALYSMSIYMLIRIRIRNIHNTYNNSNWNSYFIYIYIMQAAYLNLDVAYPQEKTANNKFCTNT